MRTNYNKTSVVRTQDMESFLLNDNQAISITRLNPTQTKNNNIMNVMSYPTETKL